MDMKKAGAVVALTVSLLSGVYVAYAGQQMPMTFFVTSVGGGKAAKSPPATRVQRTRTLSFTM